MKFCLRLVEPSVLGAAYVDMSLISAEIVCREKKVV